MYRARKLCRDGAWVEPDYDTIPGYGTDNTCDGDNDCDGKGTKYVGLETPLSRRVRGHGRALCVQGQVIVPVSRVR